MPDDPESIRKQAAILSLRKKARVVEFTNECPCDWRPRSVINPEDGQPFTESAAWNLIAKLLEQGESLELVELANPPGKKAYSMVHNIGGRIVYIKFQLGAGKIIGRSFHYSNFT
jgi:hypothetical protein